MLVIGTGDLASDMLTILAREMNKEDIVLYNDVQSPDTIYYKDYFKILSHRDEAVDYFKKVDNRFIVSIGDNQLREKIAHEFTQLGGYNASFISKNSFIGISAQIAPTGVFVFHQCSVSMNARIDEGSIVYIFSGIGHNSHLKKYCLVSSDVTMSNVTIGEYSTIGIGVKFKPGITLGAQSLVGTGSVVTKSFGDHAILYGVPAIQKTV